MTGNDNKDNLIAPDENETAAAAEKERPTTDQIELALAKERRKKEVGRIVRSTLYVILIVAAVSILIATLFLPVLQVTGNSMEPTMSQGQIIIANKNTSFKTGDLVAFYYNNKVLLKRVIGGPGDIVHIDAGGNVAVNGVTVFEPYVSEKSLGICDIEFPYQVPDSRIFVLGDHRSTSVDSRTKEVGCIPEERVIGKILFRVWPLNQFGVLK